MENDKELAQEIVVTVIEPESERLKREIRESTARLQELQDEERRAEYERVQAERQARLNEQDNKDKQEILNVANELIFLLKEQGKEFVVKYSGSRGASIAPSEKMVERSSVETITIERQWRHGNIAIKIVNVNDLNKNVLFNVLKSGGYNYKKIFSDLFAAIERQKNIERMQSNQKRLQRLNAKILNDLYVKYGKKPYESADYLEIECISKYDTKPSDRKENAITMKVELFGDFSYEDACKIVEFAQWVKSVKK